MQRAVLPLAAFCAFAATAQTTPSPSPGRIIDKAFPSIVLILAGRATGEPASIATGVVVRENGVVLTANHVVKDAVSLQVRFKNGEVFDSVELLGVDARRGIAALRIAASRLPVLPIAPASQMRTGDALTIISHAGALPWSVSAGVISAYRLADEVPGAGMGYRLLQIDVPATPGSSGGVLLDASGAALGLIVGGVAGAQNLTFAVPLEPVSGLAGNLPTKTFANGAGLRLPTIEARVTPSTTGTPRDGPRSAQLHAPERSEQLSVSKDRSEILKTFKTMYVDAHRAKYFGSDQLKAALGRNKDFALLEIRIVDDPKIADTVLEVGYTFAWDFPFQLKHQNTTTVLLAGKGEGPFSGPLGAASVASEFAKAATPFRAQPPKK